MASNNPKRQWVVRRAEIYKGELAYYPRLFIMQSLAKKNLLALFIENRWASPGTRVAQIEMDKGKWERRIYLDGDLIAEANFNYVY